MNMYLVALVTLQGPVEAEAEALARDLGLTAFEARQRLTGSLPLVLLRSPDREKARQLGQALVARGHHAVGVDLSTLPPPSQQVAVRDFRLEADAFVHVPPAGPEQRLPWTALSALVRAMQVTTSTTTQTSRERNFSLGRAVLTQGLSVSKEVVSTTTSKATAREPVLYLFHSGGPPWVLLESALRYGGLGPRLRPIRADNFAALVAALREHAPKVPYDERLVQHRGGGREAGDAAGPAGAGDTPSAVDVLAHVVWRSLGSR